MQMNDLDAPVNDKDPSSLCGSSTNLNLEPLQVPVTALLARAATVNAHANEGYVNLSKFIGCVSARLSVVTSGSMKQEDAHLHL